MGTLQSHTQARHLIIAERSGQLESQTRLQLSGAHSLGWLAFHRMCNEVSFDIVTPTRFGK